MIWINDGDAFGRIISELHPLIKDGEPFLLDLLNKNMPGGWCPACENFTHFDTPEIGGSQWIDMRGQFLCGNCKLPARSRLLVGAIRECAHSLFHDTCSQKRALLFERVTPLYRYLKTQIHNLEGVEYLGVEKTPGETYDFRGVRIVHQDMTCTSYTDDSFDLLIHSDVLEHIGDFRSSLKDNHRILKPGGLLIFSAPIYNHKQHIEKAKINAHGLVEAIGDAIYHGNPLTAAGSLVFNLFGYGILDDLAEAGFRDAAIGLNYSVIERLFSNGNKYYAVGNMWPIVVRGRK
jgi:SAM-dependent methyltransferase